MSTISRKLHIQHTAAAGLCSAKEVKNRSRSNTMHCKTVSANANHYFIQEVDRQKSVSVCGLTECQNEIKAQIRMIAMTPAS